MGSVFHLEVHVLKAKIIPGNSQICQTSVLLLHTGCGIIFRLQKLFHESVTLLGVRLACHVHIRQAFAYLIIVLVQSYAGIDLSLKHIYKLYLMIVIGYIPLSLSKHIQLVLDVKQGLCHGVFLTIPAGLRGKCLLDDLLYEQILHNLPCGPVICLEICSDMTLCLVDSPDDLPMAFMKSVSADESLILTLLVKYADFQTHVTVSQLFEIVL